MKTNYLSILVLALILILQTSCSTDSTEIEQKKNLETVTIYQYTTAENELIAAVNNYRLSQGLNVLEVINHISHKSQEHNFYMIENNVVNHDLFEQRSRNIIEVLGAKKVGENVGYNFQSATGILNAWLLSPGHKINLDGDYTHIGISISVNPANGKKYYTNMFMKR